MRLAPRIHHKPIDWTRLRAVLHRLSGSPSRRDILVIEDDEGARRQLVSTLAGEGWCIIEAENGREGFKRLGESRPSLILLDLMMPEMDGFEFLRSCSEVMRHSAIFRSSDDDLRPERSGPPTA